MNRTHKKTALTDTVFLLSVGLFLAWSLVAGISDVINAEPVPPVQSLIRLFFVMGAIRLIFVHKYAMWAAAVLLIGGGIFLLYGFFAEPEYPRLANDAAAFLQQAGRYIGGQTSGLSPEQILEIRHVLLWVIHILAGLIVVLLGAVWFQFLALFVIGGGLFGVFLASSRFDYNIAFYVFALCNFFYLLKHLGLNSAKIPSYKTPVNETIRPKTRNAIRTASFAVYAAILAGISIAAALFAPTPPVSFAEDVIPVIQSRIVQTAQSVNTGLRNISRPGGAIPVVGGMGGTGVVGFAEGYGGRLGGDVRMVPGPPVMRIRQPDFTPGVPIEQAIYLTGAIFDTYTGYAWETLGTRIDEFDAGAVNTAPGYALEERIISALTASIDRAGDHRPDRRAYINAFMTARENIWDASDHPHGFFRSGVRNYIEVPDDRDDITRSGVITNEDGTFNFIINEPQEYIRTQTPFIGTAESPFLFEIFGYLEYDLLDDGPVIPDIGAQATAVRQMELEMLDSRLTMRFAPGIVHDSVIHTDVLRRTVIYLPQSHEANPMREQSRRGILTDVLAQMTAYEVRHRENLASLTVRQQSAAGETVTPHNVLLETWIARADLIYNTYTALPAAFPESVRVLAHNVTIDGTSDYARMRLLEAHLSSGYYVYTLTPGTPPQGIDFVEHFLFAGRRGYCTYFATAFVTMARALGMPARYIEGFMASGTPSAEGYLYVYNHMAHAWAEVYFEGYGWIRFEPTPAAGVPQADPPPPFSGEDDEEYGEESENGEDDDSTDGNEDEDEDEDTAPPIPPDTDSGTPQTLPGQPEPAVPLPLGMQIFLWSLGGLAALTVFALLLFGIRAAWVRARNRRAVPQEARAIAVHEFGRLLRYLKFFKFEMQDSESAAQFVERIYPKFDAAGGKSRLLDCTQIFIKARYSQAPISPDEHKAITSFVQALDSGMRRTISRKRYWYYKYVLARV